MSSLQKFHRRTNGGAAPPPWPATAIGCGDITHGFWLGTASDGTSKLISAPKSTDAQRAWGSSGTYRNVSSTTDGLANTNTLYAFGSAAHPAAYYAKSLTTGGYNTWYLPAKDELMTMYSNKSAVPFAPANAFADDIFWSSTERFGTTAWYLDMPYGSQSSGNKGSSSYVRAVRRTAV